MTQSLLDSDEPPAAEIVNEEGKSSFFFACDHASNRIPRRLGTLGLSAPDRLRHIAWDIGIAEVGRILSHLLDAALILQRYSRLVVDCNRDPGLPNSIPEVSETTTIPGNCGLSEAARQARLEAVFRPYHEALAAVLDQRAQAGRPTVLVTLHSFTPIFKDLSRIWHIGVLFNRDARLARPLLGLLRAETDLVVGENEPYRVSDLSDYTVPVHGERRGLLHVEIEIRQDLITDPVGQAVWAERLARLLPAAYAAI